MKNFLLLLLSVFTLNAGAQNFTKSTISNTGTSGAFGILNEHIDGDTLMDLVGTAKADNSVFYYINNGGGSFTQHVIDNNLTGATFVDAFDMDTDGDIDFVAVGTSDLVWYENDGNFSFTRHDIDTVNNAMGVLAQHVASSLYTGVIIGVLNTGDNKLTMYLESSNSSGFARNSLFDISVNSPYAVHGGDFNNDGTEDLLITSFSDDEIVWYYQGSIGFSQGGTIATGFDGAYGVEGGDLDLDGDDDVVAAAYNAGKISWFENVNGDASLFTEHVIDSNMPGASYVHWLDIDSDGDKDIVAGAYGTLSGGTTTGHQLVIYYNDGNQNYTKTVIDDTEQGVAMFSVQDFNDDGAYDIAYASNIPGSFVLLTSGTSAINNVDNQEFTYYPNPVTDVLKIKADVDIKRIKIVDITGRIIIETSQNHLDVSALPSGYYLLQVSFSQGQVATKKILIN